MRIHWFAFTVHAPQEFGRQLWEKFFYHSLGELVNVGRKGRGFEQIDVALQEAKFYCQPVGLAFTDPDLVPEYFHVEIPGSACDCLVPDTFRDVLDYLQASGLRWNMKRLDLAFDDVPFTPVQFCDAVLHGQAVTLAKRESLSIIQSPFELRKNQVQGTSTCYLGSKDSQRFIRVYDERGATRLEFVCRDERSHVVALDIFKYHYSSWHDVALSHLVQYIRFKDFPAWGEFINSISSADIKISSARNVSLTRLEVWLRRQVAVALSVYMDVWGEQAKDKFDSLISHGWTKDRSRYAAVLQLANQSFVT